jgi:Arf-GAP/SH3 domain/ANK repeat/PH domain-containing protein
MHGATIKINLLYGHMFVLQDIGETALHLAVVREMGNSLHLVDFLVQNMPTQALDKFTLAPSDSTGSGSNTALHLCALHDKPECMKLLLRSGADPTLRNAQDKTPLDIAQDRGHHSCEELVSQPPVFAEFQCTGFRDFRHLSGRIM